MNSMLLGSIAIPGRPSLGLTTLPWQRSGDIPDCKQFENSQSRDNDKSKAKMQ
jgi:hypothetical protein